MPSKVVRPNYQTFLLFAEKLKDNINRIVPAQRLLPNASVLSSGMLQLPNEIESYVNPHNGHLPDNAAQMYPVLALAFEQAGTASIASFPTLHVRISR